MLMVITNTKEYIMHTNSSKSRVKHSVGTLKVAYLLGVLKGHPSQVAVDSNGHEVLASWGSAMRR